ncbi:hypothetical protein PG993_011373 [Apiospora rasikravindrae]|uniref:RING-type domain-containing protein n=1 Tax=Apiospora rasikravindrae TaxID=990691 RepID=A0ABR1SE12_9PEZI
MSSSNSPSAGREVIETCWIHDVAAYIGKAGQSGEPVLSCTCIICQTSILDISTCVGDMIKEELAAAEPVDSRERFYEKYNLEPSIFLRCGHILGETCFEHFMEAGTGLCPICRVDNCCDGCGEDHTAAGPEIFVPWPLNIADHQPYQHFRSNVPLTKAEIAPGTKLFCEGCITKQTIRQWAKMTLLCPTCPACNASHDGEGSAEEYPEDHRVWRSANVDPWIRRQLRVLSELVLPSRAGLRVGDGEAQESNAQQLAARRAAWVERYMNDEGLVRPLRRILFRPCEQDRERGDDTAPLLQVDFDALDLALGRILEERLLEYKEPKIVWFRGDDQFEWHDADEQDPNNTRQNFAEITGTETFIQALFFVNPLALVNLDHEIVYG